MIRLELLDDKPAWVVGIYPILFFAAIQNVLHRCISYAIIYKYDRPPTVQFIIFLYYCASTSDVRHLIEVEESTLNGLGVFAKANIPRGSRVIAEPALLEVKGGKGGAKDIVRAFKNLPSSQRNLYLQLHGYACDACKFFAEREMEQNWQQILELHRTVLAIYAAKAFGNVFLLGSHMNHSCLPNVHFAYNSAVKKETFHAIRDIMLGEELTITYADGTNRTRNQRQAELDK